MLKVRDFFETFLNLEIILDFKEFAKLLDNKSWQKKNAQSHGLFNLPVNRANNYSNFIKSFSPNSAKIKNAASVRFAISKGLYPQESGDNQRGCFKFCVLRIGMALYLYFKK